MKAGGLTSEGHAKPHGLRVGGEGGIPGVAVKCVDIRRNTGGEGGLLDDH